MYWVGVFTAGMTAFYVFRALFMCFFGEYRGHHHPHESWRNFVMWGPLAILAVLSLGGGFINIPKFLEPMFPLVAEGGDEWLMYVSVAAGVGGILLAYVFYVSLPRSRTPSALLPWTLHAGSITNISSTNFTTKPSCEPVVDGSRTLLWRTVDVPEVIDGAVNGIGKRARNIGGVLKLAQSGYIRSYAAWVVAGSILLLIVAAVTGGLR
jgi:NADH-quinone oxidoreductase subunit L